MQLSTLLSCFLLVKFWDSSGLPPFHLPLFLSVQAGSISVAVIKNLVSLLCMSQDSFHDGGSSKDLSWTVPSLFLASAERVKEMHESDT